MKRKLTFGDRIFEILLYICLLMLVVLTLYPFINSVAISLNDSNDTARGGITLFPRIFTLRNYELIFENQKIYTAYFVTIARTGVGTVLGLIMTAMIGFGMAHRNLKGYKLYTMICLITMYFGGGLIPYYFLIKYLGLTDNFLVYIIPNLVGVFNLILMRTYFMGISPALEESARIDGANYFRVFFGIILPISTPILATVALFIGVFQWNSWFDTYLFINKHQELKPMQNILLSIIAEAQFMERLANSATGSSFSAANMAHNAKVNVRSITMATMIVTVIPIIMAYPFLQRYFIKGIMIGSLKG
jgi:putative aldouronate transport system permease protein